MTGRSFAFVLCDQSTLTDDAHGGPLTSEVLVSIAAAVTAQMNDEVAEEWGCSVTFRVGAADASDVKPNEIACLIKDSLPEAPGAAAYHDRLANGAPVAYFAREDYTSHTQGTSSLSVDISHECIETIGDPGANRWADILGDGSEKALELCDQVQNTIYSVNGVSVSNFLLNSAFDPGANAPWDHMGVMKSQDDYSSGYEIVRVVDQQASQEQALKPLQPGESKKDFLARVKASGFYMIGNEAFPLLTRYKMIVHCGKMRPKQKQRHHASRTRRRGVGLFAIASLLFGLMGCGGTSLSPADRQLMGLQTDNCRDALSRLADSGEAYAQVRADVRTCICSARGVIVHAHQTPPDAGNVGCSQ
jgi:hypothetical protein